MKTKVLILIFGFIITSEGFPQVALVLKDIRNGREWTIRKGKIITLSSTPLFHEEVSSITYGGILTSFTDSSLTLHSGVMNVDKTVLFSDIDQVTVKQKSFGETWTYFLISTGLAELILAPFAGINDNGPYKYSVALATLGFGVVFTGTGFLILNHYSKSYRISGICHTRNERYLRNKNGTYFYSLAAGAGVSYGGMGFRLQVRLGGITGVGFHLGAGWSFPYFPDTTEKIAVSGAFSVLTGIKFFPYRGWYLDVQFGNFGRIANVSHKENKIIIGPVTTPYGFVFTVGGDWFFGRHFGLNLGYGIVLDLTAPESSNTFPAIDAGFIIKL